MKKHLALFLAITMLLGCVSLVACTPDKPEETTGSTETVTEKNEQTTTEKPGSEATESKTQATTSKGDDTTEPTEPTNPTQPTETTTPEVTTTQQTEATTTSTEQTTQDQSVETTEHMPGENTEVYGNGNAVDEAGADWSDGFFADTAHNVNEASAVAISASDLVAKLLNKTLQEGAVYRVTDAIRLESDKKYVGNGAAIIAEGGIIIKDKVDVILENVIVVGSIAIQSSKEVKLHKVDVSCAGTPVSLSGRVSEIEIRNCRIRGGEAGINGKAEEVTVYQSYVSAANAISIEGDLTIIQDCKVIATDSAISLSGDDCIVRENTVTAACDGTGITLGDGARNALIALNDISDVQRSITVNKGYNCSVIMNRAISVYAENNVNLYVVDNSLGGHMRLILNDYLVADGNTYPEDSLNHKVAKYKNTNQNGNSVTDVDARVEVGANEDILPHTNKELFVGMDRKTTVADASFDTRKGLRNYLDECADKGDVIIIPPGAYSSTDTFNISEKQNGCNIYAYGVYHEYSEMDFQRFGSNQLNFSGATDVNLYGLTVGYAHPSSGQVRVVEKMNQGTTYKLRVIADAGFLDGFGKTNPELYQAPVWWSEVFFNEEDGIRWDAMDNFKGAYDAEYSYDANGKYDGTIIITLKDRGTSLYGESQTAKALWDKMTLGTVITCRLGNGIRNSICLADSQNVVLRDIVLYGYSAGMSVYATGDCDNIEFIRYHDTTHSGTLIDKNTYDKYVAIEEKWGVDFELEEEVVNGQLRYRGAESRSSSVDGFHISGSRNGINITSSILESMVDDGSNQKSLSARLHEITDNGDGTTTIIYKPTATGVTWGNAANGTTVGTQCCADFKVGDIIYISTPAGKTVCEGAVLSATVKAGFSISDRITDGGKTVYVKCNALKVTVKTEDVDFDALINPDTGKPYDLFDNSYRMTNKLHVDNLSRNGCNYTIDNVMVRNAHSRGFLIKSRNVTIKHCTFRNLSINGILIRSETEWAESTIAKNVLIQQCLFDNVGTMYNNIVTTDQSPIRIEGTSTIVSDDTLPIDNITITGCKFTNNSHRYTIYVNSAKNVKITNNVFDPVDTTILPQIPPTTILLNTCMNIEVSDNTYNLVHYQENGGDITTIVTGNNYANVFGTDVTDEEGKLLIPDKIKQ